MNGVIEIEIDEELRFFNRLLLSYNDFRQAHEVASVLVEGDYYEKYPENRTIVHALNLAAIVAYARPFKNSRGELALRKLPDEILNGFSEEQLELHSQIIADRDTMMAHSDADANGAMPHSLDLGHRKILLPVNASPYATPLLSEAMSNLAEMAFDLQEKVFSMRQEMEPSIINRVPVAKVEDDT